MRVSGLVSAEWLEERRAQLERFVRGAGPTSALHRAPDFHIAARRRRATSTRTTRSRASPAPRRSPSSCRTRSRGYWPRTPSPTTWAPPCSAATRRRRFPPSRTCCASRWRTTRARSSRAAAAHRPRYIERQGARRVDALLGGAAHAAGRVSARYRASRWRARAMGLTVDRLASCTASRRRRRGGVRGADARLHADARRARAPGDRRARGGAEGVRARAAALAAKRDARARRGGRRRRGSARACRRRWRRRRTPRARAKAEYEAVAARLDAEMARFQREKLADFKHVVIDFVKLQLEYSQKVHAAWAALLPQLDAPAGRRRPRDARERTAAGASVVCAVGRKNFSTHLPPGSLRRRRASAKRDERRRRDLGRPPCRPWSPSESEKATSSAGCTRS